MKMTDAELIEWAQRINERDEANEIQREAKLKAEDQRRAEEAREYRIKRLNEWLVEINLPLQVEEDFIRFGEYELRAGGTRSSGFGLSVWSPAPYDLYTEPWDDGPDIKQGEMAYARYDLGYSSDLASWILDPKTDFPPQRKPKPCTADDAEEVPAYIPSPPPPSTAEQLASLIRDIIRDEYSSRIEELENRAEGLNDVLSEYDRRINKRAREINQLEDRIDRG